MKKLYSVREIEKMIKNGEDLSRIPEGALLTPSAKDLIRQSKGGTQSASATVSRSNGGFVADVPANPDYEYRWVPGKDAKTPEECHNFYYSEEISVLRQRMSDMGRRMWEREYTDGNGGNLTIRVGDNLVLCTPTLICKGYMKAEDMCLVDLDGNQLAGKRKRTSEVMTHIAVMKANPAAKSCCHAHPVHATAFAVSGLQPPTCMIPEAEVFLGQIGLAEYQTPGSPENARVVGDAAKEHNSILMLNHGVICWGSDIEDAYWKMENTESYCKTIWITMHLSKDPMTITGGQAKELIGIRKSLGMNDKRENWEECQLCDNSEFQSGVVTRNNQSSATDSAGETSHEELVQQITGIIMDRLK